ncbi:WD40-repeat-containing domain protein [Aspergillus keveii]|uniref:WD40-repeat-containing domain protein n=1 Tax=Aspergillus keveii TaxID=714993 RepID=A0ABR4GJF9_9EURO
MSESTEHESTATVDSITTAGSIELQDCQYLIGPTTIDSLSVDLQDSPGRGRGRARDCRRPIGTRRNSRSPNSRDRFISLRDPLDPPSTPYRVGKDPKDLSPEERLFRRRSPREDPFTPRKTRRSKSATRASRVISPHYGPHLVNDSTVSGRVVSAGARDGTRRVSNGAIWAVGGTSAALGRRSTMSLDGPRGLLASGTTAPMYAAKFLPQVRSSAEDRVTYESRIALALNIDPAARVLNNSNPLSALDPILSPSSSDFEQLSPLVWKDNAWRRVERGQCECNSLSISGATTLYNVREAANNRKDKDTIVPSLPFRTLDAPLLRDDFYCSTLAYSPIAGTLAVGLGHRVYLWSEAFGVQHPPLGEHDTSNYVTSLSFSSENGGRSILAVGRKSGMLSLWSTFDSEVRFEISNSSTITSVAFKQGKSRRLSERFEDIEVDAEDLAVGDDLGNIWYYSVEWPHEETRDRLGWHGRVTLLAKISAHTQQICGIAWSPDGAYLATGGNDNACLLFELSDIIPARELGVSTACLPHQNCHQEGMSCPNSFSCFAANASRRLFNQRNLLSNLLPTWTTSRTRSLSSSLPSVLTHTGSVISGGDRTVFVPSNRQKHRLIHSAAVKAIAFAPWQPSLLATGGGSNDRAIHFFHTPSGACLATINVYAQVTSLIWSKTRRELVATFGFAQPEHPFRIAVFSWPSCEQIAAIPWGPHGTSWDRPANDTVVDCGRALCAVSYPGRPSTYLYDGLDDPEDSSSSNPRSHGSLTRRGRDEASRRLIGRVVVRPRAKEGGLWCSRTVEEGCIIVASSDQSVKFHEVWSGSKRHKSPASGPYGGSEILEGLEGLENPGREIIR